MQQFGVRTYGVRFACHVKAPPFKLGEGLEEQCYEGVYVAGSVFRCLYFLPKFGVGEACADTIGRRLVPATQ